MKILVTGAAGFIGAALIRKLVDRGDEVVGLDNINTYYDTNLKYGRLQKILGIPKNKIKEGHLVSSIKYPNYRFIKLNLEDNVNLQQLFGEEKFDAVCNLAAQAGVRYSIENPYAYVDSNLVGFINILEACRHHAIKHLIYASSSSVYGMNKKVPFSENDKVDHPVSLYAATKKANELMAHTYSHLYNLPTTGLRFFTVYGPWGRPDMAPFLFVDAIAKGNPIKVFNNGDMLRDFTFIDDIVEGVTHAIDTVAQPLENEDSTAPYAIYNIGNSNPVQLMDFIQTIENCIGKEAKKTYLPMQPGDVYKTYADTSAFEHAFNFKPSTDISQGVKNFVDWYCSFYEIR